MKANWNNSEKKFLANLFSRMGNCDYLWRDDAIIVPLDSEKSLLYSIDNAELIFDTQDRKKDMRLYGRWAASLIASDVIACGIMPKGLAVDMGIRNMSESDCECFIDGIMDVCTHYNMRYEGGNINTTDSVSGLAWACGKTDDIIRREGAQVGDIIFITCDLGVGWADKLLRKEQIASFISDYKDFPVVNTQLFKEVWSTKAIHCGMDLTDGVIEFAYEINDRTGFGVIFDPKPNGSEFIKYASTMLKIPEIAFRFDPGYDTPYAHGWCIQPEKINLVTEIFKKYNVAYTIMGYIDDTESNVLVRYNGQNEILPRYSDDIINSRGSVEIWKEQILSLFK